MTQIVVFLNAKRRADIKVDLEIFRESCVHIHISDGKELSDFNLNNKEVAMDFGISILPDL